MRLTTALLGLSLFAGCASDATPADPATVRAHLDRDLHEILAQSQTAFDRTSPELPNSAQLALLMKPFASSGITDVSERVLRRAAADPDGTGIDPDAIVTWLDENLFTDANYQGDGVYRVPSSLACDAEDLPCAQRFDKAELRIRVVEESDDELSFAVQVDANRDEPLALSLTRARLGASLDLDEAAQAMAALAPIFGGSAPNASLSGEISASLEVVGGAHVQAGLSFDRAIAVKFADDGVDLASAAAFSLASAKADVLKLDIDGGPLSASAALGLGATAIHAPGDDGFDLDLPGATLFASLDGASAQLTLAHLSLGDRTTTLKKHGATALAIDLNPDDGRELQVVMHTDERDVLTATVAPTLDARVAIDHALMGDDAPVYDVTRVLFSGAAQIDHDASQLKIVSGALSITTNPAAFGVSASAGACLAPIENYDDASGQPYTQWQSVSCAAN